MSEFQSFWFGEELPPYQRLAMKSFVDFGHRYTLYGYRKFDVPEGVALRDANEILPESRVFLYGERAGIGRGSVAGFANLFRYHLLHREGGWWVDTDVVCLSDKVPSDETFIGWEDEELIGCAILRFPEDNWVVRELRDAAERAGADVEWGATGPRLLTRIALEHGLPVHPQSTSYPVQARDALQLLMPERCSAIRQKTSPAPFLHLWNEVMRRAVVFTRMAPPPGSFLAELFDRHGVGFDGAPAYTADQIQRLNENYSVFAFGNEHIDLNRLLRSQVDVLHAEVGMRKVEAIRRDDELKGARDRAERLAAEVAHLEAKMAALQTSTTWRLTAPVRLAVNLFRFRINRRPQP